MSKKNIIQEDRVLGYIFKNGSITSLDAIREFGITRLSAKIYNLRKEGFKIRTDFRSEKNRYGDIVSFAVYSLEDEDLD